MSTKIGNILFVVVLAGVMLYVFRSGVVNKSLDFLKTMTFSTSTTSSSSGNGFYLIQTTTTTPSNNNGASGAINNTTGNGSQTNSTTVTINPADIPPGFTAGQLSPYFQEVHIGEFTMGSYAYYGQMSLYANLAQSSTLDITGWQIKTKNSGEYIPTAINLYDPSGITPPTDIILKSGDEVLLYTSTGPFNLRLNECIGYIAEEEQTNPRLPESCPSVDYSQIQNFSGECQNYIESLGDCQVPDLNNAPISQSDYQCVNYLENKNYKTCFADHLSDSNFLSNQIWVWTGSNILDPYHDQIELLDRNGLLVDVRSY